MKNNKGRFKKGEHASPKTEFKPGQHWREPKPHWDYAWLYAEYIVKERSSADIAKSCDCTEGNILYFLHKHSIPRRSISEARAVKHWGSPGEQNGMYGRIGEDNPNWKGGCTADRQALYASQEWAKVVQMVWKRDKATCQRCGIKEQEHDGSFHIHHIVPFENEALRTELSNLVLFCDECHWFVHSRKNTEGIHRCTIRIGPTEE